MGQLAIVAKAKPQTVAHNSSPMSSSLEQAEALAEAEFTKGSVDALKKRVDQLRAENDLLKKQRGQSEKETHEFVAYFQQELEKKDELIAKLNDQLLRSELQSKRALEDMRAQQEATVEEMKQEHGTQVAKLKSNLKLSKEELTSLNEFRHSKAKMEKALSEAQQALEAKEGKHREEMLALERRLLEQKRKEQQEFEAKMEEIRRQARVDAQQGLDDDTRKIVTDNLRMVRPAASRPRFTRRSATSVPWAGGARRVGRARRLTPSSLPPCTSRRAG